MSMCRDISVSLAQDERMALGNDCTQRRRSQTAPCPLSESRISRLEGDAPLLRTLLKKKNEEIGTTLPCARPGVTASTRASQHTKEHDAREKTSSPLTCQESSEASTQLRREPREEFYA